VKHIIPITFISAACILVGIPRNGVTARGAENEYLTGPDDVLMINVADHPELSSEQAVVSRDGTITHRIWGQVKADGLTVGELENAVRQRLSADYVKDPHVSITVLEANTLLVYLLGENGVTNAYRLGLNGRLSELIVRAGITPELCKRTMAVILRREARPALTEVQAQHSEGQDVQAQLTEAPGGGIELPAGTTVDLYELMILGRKEVDVPLRRNDWVRLVPRDPRRNESYVFVIGNKSVPTRAHRFSEGVTVADLIREASTEDPGVILPSDRQQKIRPGQFIMLGDWPAAPGQVAVFGAVLNPGARPLSTHATLGRAVAEAGLAPDAGSLSRIVLARRNANGITTWPFYMMNSSPGNGYGIKAPLQGGDVVFVIGDTQDSAAGARPQASYVLAPTPEEDSVGSDTPEGEAIETSDHPTDEEQEAESGLPSAEEQPSADNGNTQHQTDEDGPTDARTTQDKLDESKAAQKTVAEEQAIEDRTPNEETDNDTAGN